MNLLEVYNSYESPKVLYIDGRIDLSTLGEAMLTDTKKFYLNNPEIMLKRYKQLTSKKVTTNNEEMVADLITFGEEFYKYNLFSLLRNDQIKKITPIKDNDRYSILEDLADFRVPAPPPALSRIDNFETIGQLLLFGIARGMDLRHLDPKIRYNDLHDYLTLMILYPKNQVRPKIRVPILTDGDKSTIEDKIFKAYTGYINSDANDEIFKIAEYPPAVAPSDYILMRHLFSEKSSGTELALFTLRINSLFELTRGYSLPIHC